MAQQTVRTDAEYMTRFGEDLSDSSKRAKWIGGLDEHEEHEGQSLATRNHEVIRRWADERQARPSTIAGTEQGDRPGVLRFDFPGYDEGRPLTSVSWDDWFRTFEERDLVFVYQEHLKKGNQSNFFTFDSPHRERG